MNISQPVASAIGSVDFAFLTPAEIKTLSVKRIENPLTFDSLLHPVPGGLYDPALGAWGDLRSVENTQESGLRLLSISQLYNM